MSCLICTLILFLREINEKNNTFMSQTYKKNIEYFSSNKQEEKQNKNIL